MRDQRNESDRHFNREIRRHGADLCESPRERRNYSVSIPGRDSRARPKQIPRPAISARYLVDGKTARAGVLEGDRGAESPSSAPPPIARAARAVTRDQVVRFGSAVAIRATSSAARSRLDTARHESLRKIGFDIETIIVIAPSNHVKLRSRDISDDRLAPTLYNGTREREESRRKRLSPFIRGYKVAV